MKTDDELRARRAVTLAYHPVAVGPLLDALHAGPPLAQEPIVLTESGEGYRAPATVWVVEPTDYRTVRMILDAAGERSAPFTLPDLWLAEHAGELLESLAGHKALDWTQMLLERTSADCSALEAAAATFRSGGADGQTWETFLGWVEKNVPPC